jgi:hypothetical protein
MSVHYRQAFHVRKMSVLIDAMLFSYKTVFVKYNKLIRYVFLWRLPIEITENCQFLIQMNLLVCPTTQQGRLRRFIGRSNTKL